jgi:hypothetical protein
MDVSEKRPRLGKMHMLAGAFRAQGQQIFIEAGRVSQVASELGGMRRPVEHIQAVRFQRMRMTSTAVWNSGAMSMRVSVTAEESRLGMTTGMAFMKITSTRWKVFGPCCDHCVGCIEASHKRTCRYIWASLRVSPR